MRRRGSASAPVQTVVFWRKIGADDADRTRDPNLGKWSILCARTCHAVMRSSCKSLFENPNASKVVPGRPAGTRPNLLPQRELG
jgi:hypothetical protein